MQRSTAGRIGRRHEPAEGKRTVKAAREPSVLDDPETEQPGEVPASQGIRDRPERGVHAVATGHGGLAGSQSEQQRQEVQGQHEYQRA